MDALKHKQAVRRKLRKPDTPLINLLPAVPNGGPWGGGGGAVRVALSGNASVM